MGRIGTRTINMDKKEMEAWKRKNAELQYEYQRYLYPNSPKDKDAAAKRIQDLFEWGPFAELISKYPQAFPDVVSRYGLDSMTEKCIGEIDKIAKGEKEYIF